MVIIPFTVSATNLNLLDTVEKTLVTFPSDNLVRVPVRLEVNKAAGTAYSLTYPGGFKPPDFEIDGADSYSDLFQGGANLLILETLRSEDAGDQERVLFSVPLHRFLDVATSESRLVLPNPRARTFTTDAVSLKARLTCNIASGTGALNGRLYFEQYTLGGF